MKLKSTRHLFFKGFYFVSWLVLQTTSAFGSPILWTLTGVHFNNGTTASGSFSYDADTNIISSIDIETSEATYTLVASTFPLQPFEFVFVPGPLSFGAKIPALVLLPSPQLTDSGGSVPLCCSNGPSEEGAICDDACDGVTTSHYVDGGVLSATAIPEPNCAPLLGFLGLFLALYRHGDKQKPQRYERSLPASEA